MGMKKKHALLLTLVWLLPACSLVPKPGKPKVLEFTATAYSGGTQCNGPWPERNAIGGPLKSGEVNSAASDWSKLPVGTKFRVRETGRIYQIDDYGSAMVGRNKVDLYKTCYGDVYRWGVRQVNLEIMEWGCPERSLTILKPRIRHPHVHQMVQQLQDLLGKDAS
jgi:3D (Asp-Asp-Asp) domain-containing protein